MKALLTLGGLAVLVIGGMTFIPSVSETVSNTIEIEKIVTPDWATDEQAVEAAKAVIRRKELTAENEEIQIQIDLLEKRQAEIEKELGF